MIKSIVCRLFNKKETKIDPFNPKNLVRVDIVRLAEDLRNIWLKRKYWVSVKGYVNYQQILSEEVESIRAEWLKRWGV